MTGTNYYFGLAVLLVPGGLLGLLVLMEWLERHFVRTWIADDIGRVLEAEMSVETLEHSIASLADPLFIHLHDGR